MYTAASIPQESKLLLTRMEKSAFIISTVCTWDHVHLLWQGHIWHSRLHPLSSGSEKLTQIQKLGKESWLYLDDFSQPPDHPLLIYFTDWTIPEGPIGCVLILPLDTWSPHHLQSSVSVSSDSHSIRSYHNSCNYLASDGFSPTTWPLLL